METLVPTDTFAEAEINRRLTREKKIRLLSQMFRIRRFEQTALKQYQTSGQMGGFLHLYTGQESVAVDTRLTSCFIYSGETPAGRLHSSFRKPSDAQRDGEMAGGPVDLEFDIRRAANGLRQAQAKAQSGSRYGRGITIVGNGDDGDFTIGKQFDLDLQAGVAQRVAEEVVEQLAQEIGVGDHMDRG